MHPSLSLLPSCLSFRRDARLEYGRKGKDFAEYVQQLQRGGGGYPRLSDIAASLDRLGQGPYQTLQALERQSRGGSVESRAGFEAAVKQYKAQLMLGFPATCARRLQVA